LFFSFFRRGYKLITNERIVEVPFVYQNFDLPVGARVLDFGCSESKVSVELASLGYNVTGTDINDYPFTHPNFRFIKGNFLDSPFEDESFDAVVAISAVEHCGLSAYGSQEFSDGDKRVMEQMHRILKNGGKLLLTVPYGKKGLLPGPFAQRVYNRDSLDKLLDGFNVIKEEYFIGSGREHWLPATKEELSGVDSVSKGYTQGVACIVAVK
jgi:SAM-dependent methyltransferase